MTVKYIKIMDKVVRFHMSRNREFGTSASSPHYPWNTFLKKLLMAYFVKYPLMLEPFTRKVASNSSIRQRIPSTTPVEIPVPIVHGPEYLTFPGILEFCTTAAVRVE